MIAITMPMILGFILIERQKLTLRPNCKMMAIMLNFGVDKIQ